MSRFNTDEICLDCEAMEKSHPDYNKAQKAELDAVKAGVRNFQGIGLPAGYSEWARLERQAKYDQEHQIEGGRLVSKLERSKLPHA